MKNLTLLLLFLPFFSFAKIKDSSDVIFPIKDGKIVYERVVDAKGIKKEDLYAASKKWIAETFTNSKAVIKTDDTESGQILCNASLLVSTGNHKSALKNGIVQLEYYILINCKDEKYRVRIYDILAYNAVASTSKDKLPLEVFGQLPTGKTATEKEIEKVTAFKVAINDKLTLLLNSFTSSVNASNKDAF